jgi:hypothetical protein
MPFGYGDTRPRLMVKVGAMTLGYGKICFAHCCKLGKHSAAGHEIL